MALTNACPDPEQLGRFARGLLDAKTTTIIREHISHCPTCSETVASRDGVTSSFSDTEQGRIEAPKSGLQLDAIPPSVPPVELPGSDAATLESDAGRELIIEQLGPYRIVREIGRGGWGLSTRPSIPLSTSPWLSRCCPKTAFIGVRLCNAFGAR